MADNADIRKERHLVYALHAHLVFVTKYQHNVLSEHAIRDLTGIFVEVCGDFEAELVITGRYLQSVLWYASYFVASCGGAPLSIITKYVHQQREGKAPPSRPEGRDFQRGEIR